MIISKSISAISLSDDFYDISLALGFEINFLEEITKKINFLMDSWALQGFVEVYEYNIERLYGRVKYTEKSFSPLYANIYHGRVFKSENDPLFLITFEKDINYIENSCYIGTVRFIINHDDIFGKIGKEKKDKERMQIIMQRVWGFIHGVYPVLYKKVYYKDCYWILIKKI